MTERRFSESGCPCSSTAADTRRHTLVSQWLGGDSNGHGWRPGKVRVFLHRSQASPNNLKLLGERRPALVGRAMARRSCLISTAIPRKRAEDSHFENHAPAHYQKTRQHQPHASTTPAPALYPNRQPSSDDTQQALIVVLDGLVMRASFKRMGEQEAQPRPRKTRASAAA